MRVRIADHVSRGLRAGARLRRVATGRLQRVQSDPPLQPGVSGAAVRWVRDTERDIIGVKAY